MLGCVLVEMLGWEGWLSLAVAASSFMLLALTRFGPDIIMVAGLTVLLLSGVVTPEEGLAGFANEGMLTVAVLFVVVTGLTETGAVAWISEALLGVPRSPLHARARLMAPAAVLSAFVNNTPVVAVFIPAVQDWVKRHRQEPSRLLLPLSYASIAGGTCTLIGTSTNLVVNGLYMKETAGPGLDFFEPAWVGVPVALAVFVYLLTIGQWLLPRRTSAAEVNQDVRQYTVEMMVPDDSPLIGKSIEEAGLRSLPGMFLIEVDRDEGLIPAVSSAERLRAGDRLVFAGMLDSVLELQRTRGLLPATNQVFKLGGARSGRQFVEAVVAPRCPLVGRTVREGRFRTRYHAVIIALNRNGQRVQRKIGDIRLRAGDTLFLECRPSFADAQRNSRDFLLVSRLEGSHPLKHNRAPVALAIVVGMVVSAAVGLLSMLQAALVAAGMMLVTRCTDSKRARQAPDWQVLVVIAASFGIGAALEKSGAASVLASGMIGLVGNDPSLALAATFVTAALLTAFATNNVAAVLVFPICVQTAYTLDVNLMPFVITLMVAASTSFATPIGYQTNLMVFNVGGYRFADFVRVGLPLTVLVGVLTVLIVPRVWSL